MNEKVVNTLNNYTENIAVCTIDILTKMDKNTPEYKKLRWWYTDFIQAYGNIMMTGSIIPLTLTLSHYSDYVVPKISNEDNLVLVLTINDDLGYMYRCLKEYLDEL